MKTITYDEYGSADVLQLKETPKPQAGKKEILVKVHATSVTSGTIIARKGVHPDSKLFTVALRMYFGFIRPRRNILGYEFSGEVEAVGSELTSFKPGDMVLGTSTGLKYGAYAEYLCVPEKWKQGVIALKPDSMSFNDAATLPIGGMAALDILRKANIKKGQKVLIYGASGSVGTYALQLAKYFGAEVCGVCSTSNLELIKSIGADSVIDYTKEDFTKICREFDVVFDTVAKISSRDCRSVLKKKGIFLSIKSPTSETDEKLNYLIKLYNEGDLKPVIDKIYTLEQTAEAHKYADTGHKKGNVVIEVKSGSKEEE